MSETTGIAWCDATVNFWHGCKKVSEGCKFCYMYRDKDRYKQDGNVVVQTKGATIAKTLLALRIQARQRKKDGNTEPLKIFTCSWSDFFIDEADNWRAMAWDTIRSYPEFIWIILTKRPERIKNCLPPDWGEGWDNVWLCVSAENQERWNERVPILCDIPAKVRGVSAEPLIGPIDINDLIKFREGESFKRLQPIKGRIDWIILGGESGNDTGKWGYRPANEDWFHNIVDEAVKLEIPVFMKQLGTSLAKKHLLKDRSGSNLNEFPPVLSDLCIQQFPKPSPRVLEFKYSKQYGIAVVLFLEEQGFNVELIGSLAKLGFSNHDIDVHVMNSGTREDRDKLKGLFKGTVDETDWGGLYFTGTEFGDVDIFFSLDGFDY